LNPLPVRAWQLRAEMRDWRIFKTQEKTHKIVWELRSSAARPPESGGKAIPAERTPVAGTSQHG